MSATFQFSESNRATPTITDGISNINFGSYDAPNLDTSSYPVTAGNNSFSKAIQAKFTGIGTSISNMKFWKSSGGYATGETIVGLNQSGYVQPYSISGLSGASLVPTVVGSAYTIHASDGSSSGISGASGYTEYILLQMQTTGSTPSGSVTTKQWTFQYDEV